MCVCVCWPRWILPQSLLGRVSLDIAPPVASEKPFLCLCGQGGSLTSRMLNMWSEQALTSSLNCPDFLVLEFWSIEKESLVPLPWGHEGAIYLLHESVGSICG